MNPKLSIIIVDFKKSKRIAQNVDFLQKQKTNFAFEIIIIDNSCEPRNANQLKALKKNKNVQVFINSQNVGYIQANNQGAAKAKGEFLIILNPDILCKNKDTLQKMVDFMEKNKKIGIAGPKQINDDGSVTMTVRAWPKLPLQIARRTFLRNLPGIKQLVAHDEMQHLDYGKTQTVDWLQSSFWIVRQKLWNELGGLNKDYFIFMSDPDLCFKCWKKGYQVMYYPEVTVYADGIRASGGGMKDFFKKWTLRQHLKEAWIYTKNHFFKGNPRKKF